MSCRKFSVIVPLYNKQAEIGATIDSILAQSHAPYEIVVVDDGSTDDSANIVREFNSPLIRLVVQKNAGECAARNRAIAESTGDYIALIDADDTWNRNFLKTINALMDKYPDCGLYCTGFNIVTHKGVHPMKSSVKEGVVANFFKQGLKGHIITASSCAIPKYVLNTVGGFPDGMKIGGDQFMWVKIASRYKICYSPQRMLNYNLAASNRSSAIYTPEKTPYSFQDFYDETHPDRNEFLVRCEISRALTMSVKGGTQDARNIEKFYSYTKAYRRGWRKLYIINHLPVSFRYTALNLYNKIAWVIAKKI